MPLKKRKPSHILKADWDAVDSPEITKEQWKSVRPMREMFPEFVAKFEAEKKKRGRPTGRNKQPIHMSLDSDLIEFLRASGPGWQTRANNALRKAFRMPIKQV